jgi:DNA-binding NarL/FixJ family response regulator
MAPDPAEIRVVVCDDSERARKLVGWLSDERKEQVGAGLRITGEATTAAGSLDIVRTSRCDVVLIDLFLPQQSASDARGAQGPWVARDIVRWLNDRDTRAADRLPRPKLIMWTSNPLSSLQTRNACRAFMHRGGDYVIDKEADAGDQIIALEAALAGVRWEHPDDGITPAQRRVLSRIAAGMTRKQIADELFIQETVVQEHFSNVRRAHNVGSGYGIGGLVEAAAQPGSRISWVPYEHLGDD